MGAAKSVFNKNVLGGKVKAVVEQCKCNVGVFIEKDFKDLNNVLIITDEKHLDNLLDISARLTSNSDAMITLMNHGEKELSDELASTFELQNNPKVKFIDNRANRLMD